LTAPLSRNIYVLNLVSSPDLLPRDLANSTGDVVPVAFGPFTRYIKIIGCSVTTSNTTAVINGMNMPIHGTGVLPPPEPHLWFNMTPQSSRGLSYEDGFGAFYSRLVSVKLKLDSEVDIIPTIFEYFYFGVLYRQGRSLQVLEGWMRRVIVVSLAAIGVLGRDDVSEFVAKTSFII
jgi:hypothetical protein